MSQPHRLVGSWQVTVVENDGPPTMMLGSFHADGTVVTAEHPVVTPPGAPGVVYTSSGHGAWKATGPSTAAWTILGLGSDGQGQLFGVVTVRAEIGLGADGRSFTGTATATISDRHGVPMATFPVKLEAIRIAAEAPVGPDAAGQGSAWIGNDGATNDTETAGG
jgi:hypothetical protein